MKIDNYLQSNAITKNLSNVNISNENEAKSEGLSFLDTLKQKLDEVNEKQIQAETTTEAIIKGDDIDIHEVMLAGEEAKLSLQMAVQVRNKLVEAYQELNRMQL
jgi:flagellar hook-basal body complex protein FliE